MKTPLNSLILFIVLSISTFFVPLKTHAQDAEVNFQVFYDNLSPYGHWVQHPKFGFIWTPTVEGEFEPYSTAGHWVWNDEYGWTWASDYPWGWAPFHYGRWGFDDMYGWFWIPDEVWGPAWVCWRHSPGFYGWAPLGPGISVSMAVGGGWHPRDDRWIFVKEGYMGRDDIHHLYEPRGREREYVRTSSIVNNTHEDKERHRTYITGPRREEVETATGHPVARVEIHQSEKPEHAVNNNRLNTYRPPVKPGTNMGPHPSPGKIEKIEDVGHPSPRRAPESRPQEQHNQPRVEQPRQPRVEQPRQQSPAPRMEPPHQAAPPRQAAPAHMEQPRGGNGRR